MPRSQRVTGTMVYQSLEGGFWGIEADDGTRYRPVDPPPAAVQHEGLRVEASVRRVSGLSIQMWGTQVAASAFKPL